MLPSVACDRADRNGFDHEPPGGAMQYTIVAYDGRDEGALARRLAVREAHIALIEEMKTRGSVLYGLALLDEPTGEEPGRMCGSILVVDFPARADLDAYLAQEPYVTGKVWEDVQVFPCQVGPSFLP